MKLPVSAFAVMVLAVASPTLAQQSDAPPIRDFDVETIERLGRDIYEQDRFAWVGTDALLAEIPQGRLAGTIGWIVVERDGVDIVRFARGSASLPEPSFDVTFRGDAEPVVTAASGDFSEDELAMFRAVDLGRRAITQPCSDRYNSIILPDVDGDGWLVWMLAATTDANRVPVGGHYRFTISADGRTIEQADRLSRSCLVLSLQAQGGGQPEALMTTQLVDDLPVETFVFLSLSHQIPFYVAPPDGRVWEVEGDRMQVVGSGD